MQTKICGAAVTRNLCKVCFRGPIEKPGCSSYCFMRGPSRTSPIPAASKTMETAAGTWTVFSSLTVAWMGPIFATSSCWWYVKTGCTSPTTPKTRRMTPRMMTKRFMRVNLSQSLISEREKHADTPPAPVWRRDLEIEGLDLDLGPACCGCGGSFLGGLGCGRRFAPPLGLRRRGRCFADQLGRHDAGDEELGTVIVKIHCGALLVGSRHDSQAVHFVLDGLTFLHHLHNVLLGHSRCQSRFETCFAEARSLRGPQSLARGW